MDIEDIIEEKYTNYLNCETDNLDLTVKEAKFILANDEKLHFVDDLLVEAYKVILLELEKKDKIIDEMAEIIANLKLGYLKKESGGEFLGEYRCYNKEEIKQYFTKKVEDK